MSNAHGPDWSPLDRDDDADLDEAAVPAVAAEPVPALPAPSKDPPLKAVYVGETAGLEIRRKAGTKIVRGRPLTYQEQGENVVHVHGKHPRYWEWSGFENPERESPD